MRPLDRLPLRVCAALLLAVVLGLAGLRVEGVSVGADVAHAQQTAPVSRASVVSIEPLAPAPPVQALPLPRQDTVRVPEWLADFTLPPPWDLNAMGKLSASQAAYSNWASGGLNTLALTTGINGRAVRTSPNWKQTHTTDLALGLIQQDTLSVRKADDRLRFSSALQYRGDGFFQTFNPTLAASLRTQFVDGYSYDRNPFDEERNLPVRISDFLAPATFTQSVGLTYEAHSWLDQRLSLGAKEVLVTEAELRVLYGLSQRQPVRYEAGLESTTEVNHEPFEDVQVQSSLQLFAAFNRDGAPDMVWENLVSLKFNSWLSLDFEFTALYDRDVLQMLQMREAISLGASLKII